MAITINELETGIGLVVDGQLYFVTELNHVKPGKGSAFARVLRELLGSYGLLLVDPMEASLRELAAPLMREAVTRMPELAEGVMARSKELVERG